MEAAEAYIEKSNIRKLLTALLESTCKAKPDRLVPYFLEYLQREFPSDTAAVIGLDDKITAAGTWKPRTDVRPTHESLRRYMQDMQVKPQLEGILEAALREQPFNFVAFMINRLCGAGSSEPASKSSSAPLAPAVVDTVLRDAPSAAAASAAAAPTPCDDQPEVSAEQLEAYFDAIGSGDLEAMIEAIEGGVPVTSVNDDGATGLHLAAEGESGLLEELIKRGCPVDAQNAEGKTALCIGVQYEDIEVCTMLVGAGASKEIKDSEDKNAIDYAKEVGPDVRQFITGEKIEEKKEREASTAPRRNSVSSESMDVNKKVDTSTIKVVPKDEATKQRIKDCVKDSILFQGIDAETMETMVMAMAEENVSDGAFIINQGEEGHYFYVVDSGSFDCFVKVPDVDPPGKLVMQYGPHTSFGELALMYNAPRAASVKATSDSVVWAMDRVTFRTLLLQKMVQKRLHYESILEKVELLKSLNAYDRSSLADALIGETFDQGSTICEAGNSKAAFYLVVEGEAIAEKLGETVAKYKVGDCFGVMPLLTGEPFPVSIKAPMVSCSVARLDAPSFHRLLKSVKPTMQKLVDEQKQY